MLEKYAARMGGAQNHRMRLDDGVLIKDNHVAVCGGVAEAVRRAKAANTGLQVQVEVDRIDQIEPALAAGADRLLLDNMAPPVLREAVALVARPRSARSVGRSRRSRPSAAIAETGVDFISVGRITQSAPAVDIGLDYRAESLSQTKRSFMSQVTGCEAQQRIAELAARPLRPTRSIEEYFDDQKMIALALSAAGAGRAAGRRRRARPPS